MNSLCLSYTYANSFPTHAHIQVSGGKMGNVQSAMHMNFLFRGEKKRFFQQAQNPTPSAPLLPLCLTLTSREELSQLSVSPTEGKSAICQ